MILMATGPYVVNDETAPLVVEKIRFRHYQADELEIAKRFIRKCYLSGTYYFDMYLQTTESRKVMPQTYPFPLNDAVPWMDRIDAVCFKDKVAWIIEFKDRLRYSGIGQLEGYSDLFREQYEHKGRINKLYVVGLDKPDLHDTLVRLDIRWRVV